MNTVALLIGGNQGDRRQLIQQTTESIQQCIGSVVASSSVHETEPWGDFGAEQVRPFFNQALLVETSLEAHDVLREALSIEAQMGRKRADTLPGQPRVYHSRPMDIDIIFFNDEVISTPELVVPHPRMHQRLFVLAPLAEIIPHYRHPLLNKTVLELLQDNENN